MRAINALLIYEGDFRKRNFFSWLFSHISGAYPPHRYKGSLNLLPDCLYFTGLDTLTNTDTEIRIDKENITQVYYGYDHIFTVYQTRGLGLSWSPVRLTIDDGISDKPYYIYFVTGYHWMGTFNSDFNIYLRNWLS